MKIAKIMILAMIVAFTGTTMALAAGEVQVGRTVAVSADVKNSSNSSQQAAVRLLAYDTVGNAVGHLCREVVLPANEVITVSYLWRAPTYETGLYWSPKVTINEAIEIGKRFGDRESGAFINGILDQIYRGLALAGTAGETDPPAPDH